MCDPRGARLTFTGLKQFLESPGEYPSHYGRFGLETLMAGYHGNLVDANGRPWCFLTWKEYEYFVEQAAQAARERESYR